MLPAKSITLNSMFGSRGSELRSWTTAKARVPFGSLTRIDWEASKAKRILIGRTTSLVPSVQNRPSSTSVRSVGSWSRRRSS